MKLLEVVQGTVVRNTGNGSHYRFERPEESRAKIWPLELFPSGLLISKPTPTTVSGDIEVEVIGPWHDGMVVQGKPAHSRKTYEAELARLRLELVELEAAYEELPINGTGKQSRGSWANKIKNARYRIDVLERGLGFVAAEVTVEHATRTAPEVQWSPKQVVQLPSGAPGLVLGTEQVDGVVYVDARTKHNGALMTLSVPAETLRPWECARLCSS